MVEARNIVRMIAPASALAPDPLNAGLARLRGRVDGIAITEAEFAVYGRFAGNEMMRASTLSDALANADNAALLCVQGGYGSGRLIDHMPMDRVRAIARKPVLIGYSDISYLGAVLSLDADVPFVHGPMLVDFNDPTKMESCDRLCDYLNTGSFEPTLAAYESLEVVKPGIESGRLVGGNLSMMCSLLGTPWQRMFDGAVLIIEETFEFLYRLDRMMLQMKHAGVLDAVTGIIFGDFDRMQDSATPFGYSEKEILLDAVADFKGPVTWGAPFGHGPRNFPLPLNRRVQLSVEKTVLLTLN